MWWFRWHSRRFIRSIMNPIDEERARLWTNRLRFLYIFVAFNAMVVSFKYFMRNKDQLIESGTIAPDITSGHRKARLMKLQDVHIISTGIGRPTRHYDINIEEYTQDIESKQKQMMKDFKLKHNIDDNGNQRELIATSDDHQDVQ